jgi:hypothetical protein
MQPVLRFVEHDGLRTVDHLVRDLLAAMGRRQCMKIASLPAAAISFALTW